MGEDKVGGSNPSLLSSFSGSEELVNSSIETTCVDDGSVIIRWRWKRKAGAANQKRWTGRRTRKEDVQPDRVIESREMERILEICYSQYI